MDVKVTWQNKLAFTGSGDGEFTTALDAKPDVGGDGNGFEPMELIAIG